MSKFQNKFKETEEKWNMAVNFLNRLDRRCDERDISATQGDLLSWFRSLRAIFRNVHFEIRKEGQEEEEKKLNNLFEQARIALRNATIVQKEIAEMGVSETEDLLDEIDMGLNDLMYEYGLITYKQSRRNIEQEMEEGWFE